MNNEIFEVEKIFSSNGGIFLLSKDGILADLNLDDFNFSSFGEEQFNQYLTNVNLYGSRENKVQDVYFTYSESVALLEDGSVIPLLERYGVPLLTPSEAEALTTDNYSEEDLKEIKALAEFTS